MTTNGMKKIAKKNIIIQKLRTYVNQSIQKKKKISCFTFIILSSFRFDHLRQIDSIGVDNAARHKSCHLLPPNLGLLEIEKKHT